MSIETRNSLWITIEAQILFKEERQGLFKLHVPLGWGWVVSVWRKNGAISKRRDFLWNRKITCEEASQNLLKSCLSFGGVWRVLIWGCMVKFGEMLFEWGLWKSCGTLHVLPSYRNGLYQNVGPFWEVRLAGIGLHTGCKVASVAIATIAGSWSHCYGLYWSMPRIKEGEIFGWSSCWVFA